MDGELIVLGCGGSAGVPTIGNWWGNCDPSEPRNVRTRPSIAVRTLQTLLIVDTGPDFQAQMNRENLGTPDHIIITHAHSDHINGIDELRTLQRLKKRRFPLHAQQATLDTLTRRLDYMFQTSEDGFYPTVCEPYVLQMNELMALGDVTFMAFAQEHGSLQTVGLRFGDVAYSTDVKRLDDTALEILRGVGTWIVDAAGDHSLTNPVHMSIEEIIEVNQVVGAASVLLTHLPPTMDYQTLIKELPQGYAPAFDGLKIPIRW